MKVRSSESCWKPRGLENEELDYKQKLEHETRCCVGAWLGLTTVD